MGNSELDKCDFFGRQESAGQRFDRKFRANGVPSRVEHRETLISRHLLEPVGQFEG